MEGKYRPQQLGQKEYNKLGKTVSLMLRMCRHIFVSGNTFIWDFGFCVPKVITDIEAKGVHEEALIKKWSHWKKGFTGDLIDTHFEDK